MQVFSLLFMCFFVNYAISEMLEDTAIKAFDPEVPTLRFGELPILDEEDTFSKTGSVTPDAGNYGKVLVNLLLEWLANIAHQVIIQLLLKR